MERFDDLVHSLTGGRHLTPGDRQFLLVLLSELEQFQYQAPKDRALMFHPLGGYQRYLIHQAAQAFPKLTSFSIGDDKNRRTVVCFKSKKKEQQSELGAVHPRPMSSPRSDYLPSPHRSREELNRGPTPTSRSRDSSRSRKKYDDIPRSKTMPRSKPESSHLPRPLRAKKASTKREQLKRSRSLQSSPVHLDEPDAFLTDGEGRRGRRRHLQDKRPPRSSSLKAPSRRKYRDESPVASEDENKLRKPHMRSNVSDASLHRRAQGLRLEGRVMNGDIEDPYSCGESESDAARVDAEAISRHRRHHRTYNARHRPRSRSRSIESSLQSSNEVSEESDAGRSASDKEDEEDSENIDDDISVATVERPPSYKSLKRNASLKKAERNLSRIKRSESHRPPKKSHSDREYLEDAGSVSGDQQLEPRRSSKKKSSTMPRSLKEPDKKQNRRSTSTNTAPRIKSHVIPTEVKVRKEPSSSSKDHSKQHSVRSKPPIAEVDGPERPYSGSVCDLGKSDSTLYMPLPNKRDKKLENKNPDSSSRSKPLRPSKSTPTSPNRQNGRCCDGETQTDVTGTLSRKKKSNDSPAASMQPTLPPWQERSTTDFITAMMQSLGIQPQGIPQAAFNPMPLNAFHQFLQNNPLTSSQPSFPPHLLHQLYLSWLGAYYAGATGTWPPPFMVPSSNSTPSKPMSSYEGPPFPNPTTNNSHLPRQSRQSQENKEGVDHYYDQYYPSTSQGDESFRHAYPQDSPYREVPNSQASSPGGVLYCSDHEERFEDPRSTEYNYSNPGFGKRHQGKRHQSNVESNAAANERSNPLDHLNNVSCHDIGDRSISTDGDTDTSSLLSLNRRGEVTVATHAKGGVVVYMSSQPNSRTSSTADTHGSANSINTSDNVQSLGSTSERGSQHSLVGKKRPKKLSGASKSSLAVNRSSSNKTKEGERLSTINNLSATNNDADRKNNHSIQGSSPNTDPLVDVLQTPEVSESDKHAAVPKASDSVSSDEGSPEPTSLQRDADVSHEEMILSLRRAPLATIEDDMDSIVSGSRASSNSSLRSDVQFRSSSQHLASAGDATTLPVTSQTGKDTSDSHHLNGGRVEATSFESLIVDMETVASVEPASDVESHADVSRTSDQNVNDEEPIFPPPPGSHDSSAFALSEVNAPLIDHLDEEKSSQTSGNTTRKNDEVSDASSMSDGNYDNHSSDSSYDADQSRAEDTSQYQKTHDRGMNNVLRDDSDGDVVVQGPQFDYYNWKPNQEVWEDPKFGKFVEIKDFPPALTDIEIAQHLSNYRGLRLSRVDDKHALCILPSADVAAELLKEFSEFQCRPLSEATEATKKKAMSKLENEEFESIRSKRPKTDASVAKRLIAGSLGNSKYAPPSGNKSTLEKRGKD